MNRKQLPPGQREIKHILKWNIDHPGISSENPKINRDDWSLIIDGEVQNPVKLTWQALLNLPSVESVADFHCVEGWSVKDCKWFGPQFSALAKVVMPFEDVKFVFFRCFDGYTTSLDLKDLLKDDVILAYKLNGEWLDSSLGGPLRLVVPEKYAYKSAMWLKQIHFTKNKELGYWENRGYSDTGDVWKNDRFRK